MIPLAEFSEMGQVITLYSKMGIRAAIWGAVGASFGYSFAIITAQEPILTARAFAIGALVNSIFIEFVKVGYSDKEGGGAMQRNRIYLLWTSFAGFAAIANLNNLGYIAKELSYPLGTALAIVNLAVALAHVFKGKYIYADTFTIQKPGGGMLPLGMGT